MDDVRAGDSLFPGGGEMGARVRALDWSRTPLGPSADWPQSLKTVVRILLTSKYQMWMCWGDDLTFFCNDAYTPTLGVKRAWALGSPTREVWKEIWPDIGPRIEHVLEQGEATWDEGLLLFLGRSGYAEETYHTFSYSPLADDDGKIVGMLCVVTEETERVIGERRLLSLRQLAAEMTGKNSLAEVISAAALSLEADLKDLPFALVYLFDSEENVRLALATGVDEGHDLAPASIGANDTRPWPIRAIQEKRAALVLPLPIQDDALPLGAWDKPSREAVIAPIARQGQNSLAGFLVTGTNPYRRLDEPYLGFISLVANQLASALSNANAYEEERRRAEALAEIDRAKTAFFSNTSHEFRTPLTLMLSPLDDMLARREQGKPTVVGDGELELMHRNGIRLLKLVNTLLDFSRIEAGRVRARFEPVDLAAYTADLASTFRSAMDKANLEFVVDCPPLTRPVHVDREMWEKIVLNLVSNAFKYTLEGKIEVSLRQNADDNTVLLTVRDSGVGIPEHELPRLFERFHRIEGQGGRTQEGTGIGLALVHELARLHGGAVQAESTIGVGTAMTIAIPNGTAHLPAELIVQTSASTARRVGAEAFVDEALRWLPGGGNDDAIEDINSVGSSAPGAAGTRSTVLLADDNADMRDYVRRLLSERYTVVVAGDGVAALELARRHQPDLVLSDVMMPGLDGFGLLRAMRNDEVLRDVPIILLSARAGEEASVEGLGAGANDYLVKPFNARDLLARVRTNIEIAALRREALRIEKELRQEAELAQERAESILTSINDGFFVLDSDWNFTYVNAAAERMLGEPAGALIGQSHWARYSGAMGTPVEFNFRRAMRERVAISFENYYKPWQRWFEVRVYPARDGAISVYFQDVTDKKAAEGDLRRLNDTLEVLVHERTAELKNKEIRLRTVFETSFTYQGLMATDGTLLDANATSLEGIGAGLQDVVGKPVWDTPWFTGTPGMTELVKEAVARVADGETFRQEVHVNFPVGGWRWFDFQMRPIHNETGAVVAIVPEAVELTARREAEEALRHAQKMEAIGQLTGGVAHDFNNLLTVIRSSADLLRLRDLPEERRRRYVNAISDTADRAAKLTGQLLAFSRRQSLQPRVFDIAQQLAGVAEMLKTVLGSRIALKIDIPDHALLVEADDNQFETALVNLTANARDAMGGDGVLVVGAQQAKHLPAALGKGAGQHFIAIAVTDTGCGIAPDDIERIFEPFFTTKEVGRGTGLGLSQVYGFARQSGGAVTVESTPGAGTTFTLYLPRSTKALSSAEAAGGEERQLPWARGCILVVEDNKEVGEFSSQLLRELGYQSILASNAEEALRLLEENTSRFDLVFSDVVMPGMDGVSLGREIRKRFPKLPFLLTSGYSQVLAEEGSHEFDLLQKPYSVEDLSKALRQAGAARSRLHGMH